MVDENLSEDKCLKVNESLKFNHPSTVIPPPRIHPVAKLDSGATGSYFCLNDAHHLKNIHQCHGPTVLLPDNTKMHTSESGSLPFPGLSDTAKQAYIYPKLQSASLISVGKLCDDGCDVTFRKHDVQAIKNNNVILKGYRNWKDGLWDIPLQADKTLKVNSNYADLSTAHKINVIVPKDTAIKDLVNFMKACCFSLPKSTLLQAVKNGNFVTWPGITPDSINKFYEPTIATSKGHMNQERKYLQSTKYVITPTLSPNEMQIMNEDFFPTQELKKSSNLLCALIPFEARFTGYMDLTGRFPFTSSRGNQYILVMYDYD